MPDRGYAAPLILCAREQTYSAGPRGSPRLHNPGGTARRTKNVEDEGEGSEKDGNPRAVTPRSRIRGDALRGIRGHKDMARWSRCSAAHMKERLRHARGSCPSHPVVPCMVLSEPVRARLDLSGTARGRQMGRACAPPAPLGMCPGTPGTRTCRRICPLAARCAARGTEAPGD